MIIKSDRYVVPWSILKRGRSTRRVLRSLSRYCTLPLRFTRRKSALHDSQIYQRQIERLHEKYMFSSRLYTLEQNGVSLASVSINSAKVAKIIGRLVASGEYEFEPGTIRKIVVEDKVREVFSYRLTDLIVHRAVADVIQQAIVPL